MKKLSSITVLILTAIIFACLAATSVSADFETEAVDEGTVEEFELSAVGLQDIVVYEPDVSITFKAEVTETDKLADFQWFECDEQGNTITTTGIPLSMGDTVVIAPIPEDEANIVHYYRCTAMIGNTAKSIIFQALLSLDTEEQFELSAVGEQNIIIYSWEEKVTLEAKVTGTDKQADFQWFECDEYGNVISLTSIPLSMGNVVEIGPIPIEDMMTPHYYRCTAMIGNTAKYIIFEVLLAPMGVETEDEEIDQFELSAVGEQNIIIYSWEEKVTLEVEVTGTDKQADFQWFECDEYGNVTSLTSIPLSMGNVVEVGPIPIEEMMIPHYYRCTAMVGNNAKYVIFEVLLAPMGIETEEYIFPFTDVAESDWFYEYVSIAHQMGLINGKSPERYAPNDNMTYAEAVKLAACMNILHNGGNPTTDIANGTDAWFSTYMKYALDNGIIDEDLTAVADEFITRKEYVYIFSKALPDSEFAVKNQIPDGAIPDIPGVNTKHEKAIYKFYRAGILNGTDRKGTFNPDGNIVRSEVAAILVRIMDGYFRVGAPSELGK